MNDTSYKIVRYIACSFSSRRRRRLESHCGRGERAVLIGRSVLVMIDVLQHILYFFKRCPRNIPIRTAKVIRMIDTVVFVDVVEMMNQNVHHFCRGRGSQKSSLCFLYWNRRRGRDWIFLLLSQLLLRNNSCYYY